MMHGQISFARLAASFHQPPFKPCVRSSRDIGQQVLCATFQFEDRPPATVLYILNGLTGAPSIIRVGPDLL